MCIHLRIYKTTLFVVKEWDRAQPATRLGLETLNPKKATDISKHERKKEINEQFTKCYGNWVSQRFDMVVFTLYQRNNA